MLYVAVLETGLYKTGPALRTVTVPQRRAAAGRQITTESQGK